MNIREKCIAAMAEESWTEDMAAMLDAALAVLADPENWTKEMGKEAVMQYYDGPSEGSRARSFAAVINHVRGMGDE